MRSRQPQPGNLSSLGMLRWNNREESSWKRRESTDDRLTACPGGQGVEWAQAAEHMVKMRAVE